jgi:hypothetical protein
MNPANAIVGVLRRNLQETLRGNRLAEAGDILSRLRQEDPHVGHRKGNHADFRANGGQWSIIPSAVGRFMQICSQHGATFVDDHGTGSGYHVHAQWGN